LNLHERLNKLPPALRAFLAQVVACLGCLTALRFLGFFPTLLQFTFICGTFAALIGFRIGLAPWWIPIQFFFLPALFMAAAFNVPAWLYLGFFLILLAIYWSTFQTQVPLYLSSEKVWMALETLLPEAVPERCLEFLDVGCGVGGVLTYLAKARPDGRFHGVEYAPLPFAASWLRIKLGGINNCCVTWGSLWDTDLSRYDVVYAYLSPVPMKALWEKVQQEMRPGSLFISNTFSVPGHDPDRLVQLNDLHQSTLYIWLI